MLKNKNQCKSNSIIKLISFKDFQPRIQHLKEVSQTDEIVLFSFISNSDMFYLSQVSLSKIRGQDPRYATIFLLLI